MPFPVSESQQGLRRATRAGRDAFRAGKPVTACPYKRAKPLQRMAWLRGYATAEEEAAADGA